MSQRRSWARLGGFAAIAAPVVMWVDFITLGVTRRGYNLLTRAASELGAQGSPNAEFFIVGFFYAGGLLTVLLGLGLQTVVGRSVLWRAGAAMISVAGVLLVLSGVFPTSGVSPEVTRLHGLFSQSCFAIAALAPFPLLAGAPQGLIPRSIRRLWIFSALVALAIEGSAFVMRHWVRFPEGVFQRPFLIAITIWFAATGVWLLRHQPRYVTEPAPIVM